jgi:hypothetical protein
MTSGSTVTDRSVAFPTVLRTLLKETSGTGTGDAFVMYTMSCM